ncbi:MAG TPA: hypothetical protein VNL91_11490, partial [Thermoanaerobaculia bacterium]|nr:hypothetical protein [Thermoanaerobaculia bacterium]
MARIRPLGTATEGKKLMKHFTRRPARDVRLTTTLVLLLVTIGCRTATAPFPPLAAATPEDAMTELRARRASLAGAQSLMRIRTRSGEKVESFQAKLEVGRGDTMRLTLFTPVGTTAAVVTAIGDRLAVR